MARKVKEVDIKPVEEAMSSFFKDVSDLQKDMTDMLQNYKDNPNWRTANKLKSSCSEMMMAARDVSDAAEVLLRAEMDADEPGL